MKEFISQVLNKKSLMNNWMTLFKTLLQDVETNFGIDDLPKYIKYINKINASNLYFHVLPGIPETIDKVSYFILDKKATNDLIDAVIFSKNTSQT
jgi:anionic cell wall polymer biosynthesis LytR-Cps2A-Psr (LCP) family protein